MVVRRGETMRKYISTFIMASAWLLVFVMMPFFIPSLDFAVYRSAGFWVANGATVAATLLMRNTFSTDTLMTLEKNNEQYQVNLKRILDAKQKVEEKGLGVELQEFLDLENTIIKLERFQGKLDKMIGKSKDPAHLIETKTVSKQLVGKLRTQHRLYDEDLAALEQFGKDYATTKSDTITIGKLFSGVETTRQYNKYSFNRRMTVAKENRMSDTLTIITVFIVNSLSFIGRGFSWAALLEAMIKISSIYIGGFLGYRNAFPVFDVALETSENRINLLSNFASAIKNKGDK